MKHTLFALLLLALSSIAVDAASFTLTWTDNATTEQGFRIERSDDGVTFAEIATVGPVAGTGGQGTYVDAGLPDDTVYSYRVRAYNESGNSAYSNVASKPTPPGAPGELDLAGQGSEAVVHGDLRIHGNLIVAGTITADPSTP